jgi:hypothetical protein
MMSKINWWYGRDRNADYIEYLLDEPGYPEGAYPTLIVDGVVRDATLMPDQKTLRVFISVAQVNKITEVTTPHQLFSRKPRPSIRKPSASNKRGDRSAWPTAPDPASPGPYKVTRKEYDFGDEILALPGIDDKVELRAEVHLPVARVLHCPIVVFIHGRHQTCLSESGGPGAIIWPCAANESALPNYKGYASTASALASHGYVVVSVSANGVNRKEGGYIPDGGRLRGHLILEHLQLLSRANSGNCPELSYLTGRLDLDSIGLVGHSRGGDGIARAITLNRLHKMGFGISAALFLGGTAMEKIPLPNIHTATILPFLDGDVVNLESQIYSDISRYAIAGDALHSSVFWLGANHNYFNKYWSPGFPLGTDDAENAWGDVEVTRLSASEQRRLAEIYISGFFRLTLGKEPAFLSLFDGSPVKAPTLPKADVRSSAHFPSSSRYTLQSFETMYSDYPSPGQGNWQWQIVKGSGELKGKSSFGEDLRYAHYGYHTFLNLKSDSGSSPAELLLSPPEKGVSVDPSRYTHLSFHVAHFAVENDNAGVEVQIYLNGSRLDLGQEGCVLWPIPEMVPGVDTFLKQQVLLPLGAMSADLPKVLDTLAFVLPHGGNIYISDIALVTPSLGQPQPLALPFVSVESVSTLPTGLEQEIEVKVRLSEASSSPVSLRLTVNILHTVHSFMSIDTPPLVFEPETTSITASFRIPAGGFKGEHFDLGNDRSLSVIRTMALSNALFDQERALLILPAH